MFKVISSISEPVGEMRLKKAFRDNWSRGSRTETDPPTFLVFFFLHHVNICSFVDLSLGSAAADPFSRSDIRHPSIEWSKKKNK